MSSSALRIAVVGAAGRHARAHLIPAHLAIGSRVSHLVDLDPSVAELAAQLDARVVTDVSELRRGDVDCALVALPPRVQPVVAAQLIRGGIPVFCEKPLGPDLEAIADLQAAVRETPHAFFMSGFMWRFSPAARQLREMVLNGDFGELRSASVISRYPVHPSTVWRFETGGGVTHLNAIHYLDLLPWILDRVPTHVFGVVRSQPGSTEQEMAALLRLPASATLQFDCAWWPANRNDRITQIEIVGSRLRALHADTWQGNSLQVFSVSGPTTIALEPFDRPALYRWEAEALRDDLRAGRDAEPGLAAGLAAMELADAILRSDASRTTVPLAPPELVP